jgi:predicted nucleic acid-binding protein
VIVLDASVLIGHFEPADAHHTDATALLKAHAQKSFAASVITLAEVYVGAARAGAVDQLHQLLARLRVESLDIPAGAGRRLGELRATTKLKLPDCCVLYTAEHYTAAIGTFDDKLAARASDLGLTVVTSSP